MRVIKVLIFVSLVLLGSVASSNTYKDGTAALEARDFEIAHFLPTVLNAFIVLNTVSQA